MHSGKIKTQTVSTLTGRFQSEFAPEDESIPYRLVGSHEYMSALNAFVPLHEMSDAEEIQVYDKVIAEQPEFAFYSGILTRVGANREKVLSMLEMRDQFDREFKKSSLAWLIALARIEVGSTMAMYGNGKTPFTTMAPEGYGRDEYLQVLLDDLAAHLLALETDPSLKDVMDVGEKADSNTLAYLRRIKMVDEMLQTILQTNDPNLMAAAEEGRKKVKDIGKALVLKVELATRDETRQLSRDVSEDTRSFSKMTSVRRVKNCGVYRNCVKRFLENPDSFNREVSAR